MLAYSKHHRLERKAVLRAATSRSAKKGGIDCTKMAIPSKPPGNNPNLRKLLNLIEGHPQSKELKASFGTKYLNKLAEVCSAKNGLKRLVQCLLFYEKLAEVDKKVSTLHSTQMCLFWISALTTENVCFPVFVLIAHGESGRWTKNISNTL